MKAIERANARLAKIGIEKLGDVRPYGLRQTYASLRTACGDDPVFVSRQLGQTDVRFTLNVYYELTLCRTNVLANDRAYTPSPTQNLHGKEGVDSSSPASPPTVYGPVYAIAVAVRRWPLLSLHFLAHQAALLDRGGQGRPPFLHL